MFEVGRLAFDAGGTFWVDEVTIAAGSVEGERQTQSPQLQGNSSIAISLLVVCSDPDTGSDNSRWSEVVTC